MPFKSKAQWRACFAKNDPNWDCSEMAHSTPSYKELPKKKKQEKKAESQEDIFEALKQHLPAEVQHASGGMPDVKGLSDVDISLYHQTPADVLSLLPENTTIRSKQDDTGSIEYAVPGYSREVNVFATPDKERAQRAVDHRNTTIALREQQPALYELAKSLKEQGQGTEQAWAAILGIKDDPYVAMRDTKAMLAAAEKKAEYKIEDQTFSDSDGSYNVADLYALAKSKGEPQNLDIAELLHNLDPSPEEEGEELPGHPDFVARAEAAGTLPGVVVNYPDGKWIADGVHRLWKAQQDKKKEYQAYVLDKADIEAVKQADDSEREAVIVDKGVVAGKPITHTNDDGGITAYYSGDRGDPSEAQVWLRREAEAARAARQQTDSSETATGTQSKEKQSSGSTLAQMPLGQVMADILSKPAKTGSFSKYGNMLAQVNQQTPQQPNPYAAATAGQPGMDTNEMIRQRIASRKPDAVAAAPTSAPPGPSLGMLQGANQPGPLGPSLASSQLGTLPGGFTGAGRSVGEAGPMKMAESAEQMATRLNTSPLGTEIQTTPRDIKGHEYYDLAQPKALEYRKANPDLKFEQYLTPEAGNRPITVQTANIPGVHGQVSSGIAMEQSPELAKEWQDWQQNFDERDVVIQQYAAANKNHDTPTANRLASEIVAWPPRPDIPAASDVIAQNPVSKIEYNPTNKGGSGLFRSSESIRNAAAQKGGDTLAHEATHVMQTPGVPERTQLWQLDAAGKRVPNWNYPVKHNKLMLEGIRPYHTRQSEVEAFTAAAKRWYHQQTGQLPETPEQIDEMIKRYGTSGPGSGSSFPWDQTEKPSLWQRYGPFGDPNAKYIDPKMRKRIHEITPGVVNNQIQDKTKMAAVQGLFAGMQKVAYNPSVQSSAGQFARSAAPPAASKPAGPPMSKLPAEQLAAKLSKEPVGTEVQTTVRDLKSPEYYDPAREKALDYRKANPKLKFEQYLTPEAGNRPITVRNEAMPKNMGGHVTHNNIRLDGETAKLTGPSSVIAYNNKFTDDPQAGGDILAHEGTHIMQTPAEGETKTTPASEVTTSLADQLMNNGVPSNYHDRQTELEGFISSAKRWNWQQTGKFAETPEEIDEAINRYKASKGGQQFQFPWNRARKPASSWQFWKNLGSKPDPAYRKRIHKIWPGVVNNQMQNKTKMAAFQGLCAGPVPALVKESETRREKLNKGDDGTMLFQGSPSWLPGNQGVLKKDISDQVQIDEDGIVQPTELSDAEQWIDTAGTFGAGAGIATASPHVAAAGALVHGGVAAHRYRNKLQDTANQQQMSGAVFSQGLPKTMHGDITYTGNNPLRQYVDQGINPKTQKPFLNYEEQRGWEAAVMAQEQEAHKYQRTDEKGQPILDESGNPIWMDPVGDTQRNLDEYGRKIKAHGTALKGYEERRRGARNDALIAGVVAPTAAALAAPRAASGAYRVYEGVKDLGGKAALRLGAKAGSPAFHAARHGAGYSLDAIPLAGGYVGPHRIARKLANKPAEEDVSFYDLAQEQAKQPKMDLSTRDGLQKNWGDLSPAAQQRYYAQLREANPNLPEPYAGSAPLKAPTGAEAYAMLPEATRNQQSYADFSTSDDIVGLPQTPKEMGEQFARDDSRVVAPQDAQAQRGSAGSPQPSIDSVDAPLAAPNAVPGGFSATPYPDAAKTASAYLGLEKSALFQRMRDNIRRRHFNSDASGYLGDGFAQAAKERMGQFNSPTFTKRVVPMARKFGQGLGRMYNTAPSQYRNAAWNSINEKSTQPLFQTIGREAKQDPMGALGDARTAFNSFFKQSAAYPALAKEAGVGDWIESNIGIPTSRKGLQAFGQGANQGAQNIGSWAQDPGRLVRGVGGAASYIPAAAAHGLSAAAQPLERAITGDDTYSKAQQQYWGDTQQAAGGAASDAWTPGGGNAMQQYENIDKHTQSGALRNAAKGALAVGSTAATLAPAVAGAQMALPAVQQGAAATGQMAMNASRAAYPMAVAAGEAGRQAITRYGPQVMRQGQNMLRAGQQAYNRYGPRVTQTAGKALDAYNKVDDSLVFKGPQSGNAAGETIKTVGTVAQGKIPESVGNIPTGQLASVFQ